MTTTIKPMTLQQQYKEEDDEDIALADLIKNTIKLEQPQLYQQKKSIQLDRKNSTQRRLFRRPSFTGSVVSTSAISVQSDASITSKVSITKKIRKVFSMSQINQNQEPKRYNKSNHEIPSFRRRSIDSLSSLFQKNNQHMIDKPLKTNTKSEYKRSIQEPNLNVDIKPTPQRKTGTKIRSNSHHYHSNYININNPHFHPHSNLHSHIPDSPNSIRSNSRLPNHKLDLPSPAPSLHSYQEEDEEDDDEDEPIGLQYRLLKPKYEKRVQFSKTVQVNVTFSFMDYDRRSEFNTTCQQLNPLMAMQIKQELNEYKLSEMHVHLDSRQYTHFFL